MMRLLELFKGTGSVGRAFMDIYPDGEVISLDFDPKCNATHTCDIMDFDYMQYPVGYFNIVWASPDCRIFSVAMNQWIGRKYSNRAALDAERERNWKYVRRTLDVIRYLSPGKWFIENPYASAMSKVPELQVIPSVRKDYCMYGMPYQKPTRIWSNLSLSHTHCQCTQKHSLVITNHKPNNTAAERNNTSSIRNRRNVLHSIPYTLILELFQSTQ